METQVILNSRHFELTINRLCYQLIEIHNDFSDTVLVGLQPRGIHVVTRLKSYLETILGKEIQCGNLDITFYRDDFRRREKPIIPSITNIDFSIENKRVILVDDVLATGRMVRAALDAMNSFGRPAKVELCVLIDRIYNRDLPINADYVGMSVNTLPTEKVLVEWTEQGHEADRIWLIPQQS